MGQHSKPKVTISQPSDERGGSAVASGKPEVNVIAQDSEPKYDMETPLNIYQLGSASLLRLNMRVQDQPVLAIVDTAAEVTILSDDFFKKLPHKPPVKHRVTMHAAGKGMKMDTFVCGPVDLFIGTNRYKMDIYVAPIDDDMLLGLDFLVKSGIILDCRKQQFIGNVVRLPGEKTVGLMIKA